MMRFMNVAKQKMRFITRLNIDQKFLGRIPECADVFGVDVETVNGSP